MIKKAIKNVGGKGYFVGGVVIDKIQGRQPKDIDIEVFGVDIQSLKESFKDIGFKVDCVGDSFGVLKVKDKKNEYDISIPRQENRIGVGHTDFEITCDPSMTIKEASKRRDLTINSLYMDIETNEIIDCWNGLQHLEEGRIKATNEETFREDPLRVLRIMQLLPRKGKFVDSGTLDLCRDIKDTFSTIKPERVYYEFVKLLGSSKPSLGLQFLKDSGWLVHFPELNNLVGCPQNPKHHPEGDVFKHTKIVVDKASEIKSNLPIEWHLPFMFGALLHDVGKPYVTDPNKLTAYRHESVGVEHAVKFMGRVSNNSKLISKVSKIVRHHMDPWAYFNNNAREFKWKKLHGIIRLDVLAYFSCADHSSGKSDGTFDFTMDLFNKYGEDPIEPLVSGKDLVALGVKPGVLLGKMLGDLYEVQIIQNRSREELLKLAERKIKKSGK